MGKIKIFGSDISYNNIIAYDLSGNIDDSFNFNYSEVNNININTLSVVNNRLFAGVSGVVTTQSNSYFGMLEINPTTGAIVPNTTLQNLLSGSAVDKILPDASNNLFLISFYGKTMYLEQNSFAIAYYNFNDNTITGISNVSELLNAYYYSGYLYLQYESYFTSNRLTPDKNLNEITRINASISYGSHAFCFVNSNPYLMVLVDNVPFIRKYTNPDLSGDYSTDYIINSLSNTPTYKSYIYGFGSTLFIGYNSSNTTKCYKIIDNENVLVNGYNPNYNYISNGSLFFGSNNRVYYTPLYNLSLSQYSPTKFSNFLVTSLDNIDKVYIKNSDSSTPLLLNDTFNSLYYNGTTWEIVATTNNFVN